MEDLETAELVHALDRRTYFKKGQAEGVEILKSRGVIYHPYAERVGAPIVTASLELKRELDRRILPQLVAELPKMPLVEERFSQGYLDVRMYPHSELAYEQDGEGILFVNVVFVLGVPPNDSLDTLTRNSIVACFDQFAWQEPHDPEFKAAMCEALNGDKIINLVENIAFEGFSTSQLSSLRYSFEVDGCRSALFEAREREARGVPGSAGLIYLSISLSTGLLSDDAPTDSQASKTVDQRREFALGSDDYANKRSQLLEIAALVGLESPEIGLSLEPDSTLIVLRGCSHWSFYDFDSAISDYSSEHGLCLDVTDASAQKYQCYIIGEHDEGDIALEQSNYESDDDYSGYVAENLARWSSLFAPIEPASSAAPWTTPGVEFELPEITHENAAQTVPSLICKKAEALGVQDLDPDKLMKSTHLYRLMGCDETQTQALVDSLAEHFGEQPFFKWITVGEIVEVAKIAIWPV